MKKAGGFGITLTCLAASLFFFLVADTASGQQNNAIFYQELSWSPDGSRISFSSNEGGTFNVYVMRADGSHLTKLTNTGANVWTSWSPDSKRIAFTSKRGNDTDIYVMNADGSNEIQLTHNAGKNSATSWSPDGKRIAFKSDRDGHRQIYTMNVDGSQQTRVTSGEDNDDNPVFSPDSSKIVFYSDIAGPGKDQVYVINADGSNPTRVTDGTANNIFPSWLPDGKHIAFSSNRDVVEGNALYVVNLDGSNLTRVADVKTFFARWSPNGSKIAFILGGFPAAGIYVMSADGSHQTKLTPAPPPTVTPPLVIGADPRVSPDGSRILFSSNRTGVSQLYVMNADGSNVRQITTDSSCGGPNWSPDGKRIVCSKEQATNLNPIIVMNADGTMRQSISEAEGNQSPSWSPDGARILFAAGKFPNINIYTMNADGSERRNIAPNEGFDYDPVWSPDGKTIALVTGIRGQGVRVWVMNPDGSGRRRITDSGDNEERPAWSPDGRYLAFQASKRGGGPHEAYVHVVEMSSGADSRLGTHDRPYLDETPSWFPDGKRIAFQSDRTGHMEVWVMNADGTGQRQVTGAQQTAPKRVDNGGYPRVSPGGESILFASNRDGTRRLYLMDATGGTARALTAPGVKVSYGEWFSNGVEIAYVVPNGEATGIHILSLKTGVDSLVPNTNGAQGVSPSPDGRRLVLAGRVGKEIELHLINRDGSGDQVITSEPRFHSYPAWSPDGKEIAFTRGTSDGPKIFVMNADGSDIRRVSALSVLEEVPAWSPDGRRLAFQGAVPGEHIAHLYIATVDGREVTQVTTQSEAYLTETPSWFPDGKRIAFQSDRTGRMEVWVMNADGSDQRQVTSVQQTEGRSNALAQSQARSLPTWSPDGKRIAFTGGDYPKTQIYVVDADGQNVRQVTTDSGTVLSSR